MNHTANELQRQAIPAFRLRETWMIAADYQPEPTP